MQIISWIHRTMRAKELFFTSSIAKGKLSSFGYKNKALL